MTKFVDRQQDLHELDALKQALLQRKLSQFALVYGRRRVGKSTLLLHWAQRSGLPYLYWLAKEESPEAVRQGCARALWRWKYPERTDVPRFETWEALFDQVEASLDQPAILIFDEFTYAVASDRSLPSHLQAAWDRQLKSRPVILILAGSHIGMMTDLLAYKAPLYGRLTAQLPIEPLPFAALAEFVPNWSAAERVAAYGVLGGIPAYLEQLDGSQTLTANIKHHLFERSGLFRSEPTVLLSDVARKTSRYAAIIRAVGNGLRTPSEIGRALVTPPTNVMPYLTELVRMGFVTRVVPATLRPEQRKKTTRSRYQLRDPYLRFYFRFVEPNLEMVEQGLKDALWETIAAQFRSFTGATAFEAICQEWLLSQARSGKLGFPPETVGSHWTSGESQIDLVAVNWQRRALLLGECKWTTGRVDRPVLRGLVGKAPSALLAVNRPTTDAQEQLPGEDWTIHYVVLSRSGFTDEALAEGEATGIRLVDLAELDDDLRRALGSVAK